MSNSVDSRIVEMKFDNAAFERGINQTLNSLKNLDKSLQMDGAAKGLDRVADATKRFSLASIAAGVESINQKFSAMSAVAITALATITNKAVNAGLQIAKSLTIAPISQGFQEYETQLNAIQTILANTQAAGTTLKDVNGALAELNTYADKTIYNFSEMTRNIGTFTAAGVDLKTATGSIKGIANLAALSGSNSQQASTAMYQLSQAISAGRVNLQDWNSVVNAGMGGTVFQRALAQTAQQMGTLDKDAVKLTGKMKNATINGESFRNSIMAKPGEESWLTKDVLTKTLEQFTGDMKDAELAAMGFNKTQIKAIQAQAKTAQDAATKVKTVTQLMDTLKEAVGSGWAQTWQLIFGDFEEAKALFSSVSDTLGAIIGNSSDARNKIVKDWKEFGGRQAIIDSIANSFNALLAFIKPIGDALREIFPPVQGRTLADLSKRLRDFTEGLKIGAETADRLKRTFKGVFAVFDILFTVVKMAATTLFDLFGIATEGSGNFLDLTARIGDFLVKLRDAIKDGTALQSFFDALATAISKPIEWLRRLGSALFGLTDGLNVGKLDAFNAKLEPMRTFGESVAAVWKIALGFIKRVAEAFAPMGRVIANHLGNFGDTVADAFGNIDFDKVLALLNTGLLAGLLVLFRKFVGSFGDGVDIIGGWKESLTGPFDAMTDTLGTMQNTLRAATLLQIAAAIGILAASAVALSTVDEDALKRSLVALTTMLVQLVGAMAVMQKVDIRGGMGQLILLAAALRLLTSSVKALAELSWDELARGLAGVTGLLAALIATARLMPDGKKMIASSVGLVILSSAIKILASAVTDLAQLSWEEMSRGLSAVGGLLTSLALFTRLSAANKGGLAQGAGLLLLALGIKLLADAVISMSNMTWDEIGRGIATLAGGLAAMGAALKLVPPSAVLSAAAIFVVASSLGLIGDALASMGDMAWDEIGRGMTVLAGSLVLISAALALVPPSSLLSAAAIFVVASSLGLIGEALGVMGSMSGEEIGKGLLTLASSLGIIALAMAAMTSALPGAAALLIVSSALAVLAPVISAFGAMSLAEIGKSLLMLAGVFVVLGLAGLVLTPIVPTLLGLGLAVALLGAGMLAAGAGLLAFSAGLAALSIAGAAGTAALVALVSGLIGLIPAVMEQIGLGLVAFAKVIEMSMPAIAGAFTAILMAILTAIERITPKLVSTLLVMLAQLLRVLVVSVPMMVTAGVKIVTGILDGMAKNVGKMVKAATDLVVNFLNGLAKELPRVVDAGVKLIISFVNGIANAIRSNQTEMNNAGKNLASAIVEGMVSGIGSGLSSVVSAAKNLAKSALDAAKDFLGIHSPSREFAKLGKYSAQGYAKGLRETTKSEVYAAYYEMEKMLSEAMKSSKRDIAENEARLKKLTSARKQDTKAISKARKELAQSRAEYAKERAAFKRMNEESYKDELRKLGTLANKHEALARKLQDANKQLEDATKVRDDYNKSVKDQYSKLPDISDDMQLEDYLASLRKQVTDTQLFTAQVAELRKQGLNDEAYKQLISKGASAIPFAKQILEGGASRVKELNELGSALSKSADNLAGSASKALYQAAVDAAAGLVEGLESQQANIEKQMDKIATAMVNSIKKRLGIKSPSREFMKVGNWSAQGVAQGLREAKDPILAAEEVGANAVDAMRKTIADLSDKVTTTMDMDPHIRPVLDLSEIKKSASRIDSILSTRPLRVDGAYSAVAQARQGYQDNREVASSTTLESTKPSVSFTQNLYSPKALSEAEIYRQTNNQLSVAKGALTNK